MTIEVSVIIPVYNVENYLCECLESVINQTFKDIEVICIDDKSKDSSLKILQDYSKKDSRIKIIKNEVNKGLGETRTVGIRNSKGNYISFVDSDDYIAPDFIKYFYETAKKYDADIVSTSNIMSINEDKIIPYKDNKVYNLKDDINWEEGISNLQIENLKYDTYEFINYMSWNKLWKKDFIIKNDLFFNLKDRGEDIDIFYKLFCHNPKTAYNNKAIYYYRQSEGSIIYSRGKDISFIISAIKYIDNNINYYNKNCPQKLPYLLNKIIYNLLYEFENYEYKKTVYIYMYNYFKNLDLSEKDFLYIKDYMRFLVLKNISDYNIYNLFELQNKLYNDLENKLYMIDKNYQNCLNKLEYMNKYKDLYEELKNQHFKLIDFLVSLIPFKRLKDKFREKLL